MIHEIRALRIWRTSLVAAAGLALMTTASSALAQTRTCDISGSLTVTPPGGTTGTSSTVNAVYTETGPFLTGVVAPDTTAMTLSLVPAVQTSPTWLMAPFFQTMGVNEGPNTCGQSGDNGTITYASGPCGAIVDKFTVTNTNPYTLSHSLSGTLNLSGLTSFGASAPITRNVSTNFTTSGASGSVSLNDNTGRIFCNWSYSALYNPCHPVVNLPVTYQATASWTQGDGSAANAFGGTIVRSQFAGAPAIPPVGLAALAALVVAAGAALVRRARASST
jgi:hypothetical protein